MLHVFFRTGVCNAFFHADLPLATLGDEAQPNWRYLPGMVPPAGKGRQCEKCSCLFIR